MRSRILVPQLPSEDAGPMLPMWWSISPMWSVSSQAARELQTGQAALAEITEHLADSQEGGLEITRQQASAVSIARVGIGECILDHGLFEAGATHVLLPSDWLCQEERARGARIRLRLAAGKSAEGLAVDGEVYAPGVAKSLPPTGTKVHDIGSTPRLGR